MAERDEEDFAALFEASTKAKRIERGQLIEGIVVAIGAQVAFVSVGGKGEATIDLAELRDEHGALDVKAGDRIQAMVVSTQGGLTLSRRLARGAASARQLEDAFHSGLPVEGKVDREIKGGYEVRIGGARAFCPYSQIDIVRSEPASHLGKIYEFRIIEYQEEGRNLIVSRRSLLEAKQQERAAEVRRAITRGAIVTGRVVSLRDFGAFVDLGGGVQGLLHISEMGWSRIADASQVVQVGDEITVKVLDTDDARQKISLGLKQLTADPWTTVQDRYAVGQVLPGRVTRVADFGAFIELEPGIEALAHASTFPPTGRARGWTSQVTPGMQTEVEILAIEPEKKRIGVTVVPDGSARGSRAAASLAIVPGARLTGKVERHEPFGVFVFLAPGRTGLIPTSETGVAKESDIARTMPVGSEVQVVVLEVDDTSRRIRLSAKAVHDAEEAAEVRDYTERSGATPAQGLGSLAEKLRGALEPRKN